MSDPEHHLGGAGSAAEPLSGAAASEAPLWRRYVARAIDLTIVLLVFALFLTPVIAVDRRAASSLVKISAWVYVAVFVVLALFMIRTKTRRPRHWQDHVTVGMSIMDIRTVRTGQSTRIVRGVHAQGTQEAGEAKRGRAAVAAALPLIVLGLVFLLFELISYA